MKATTAKVFAVLCLLHAAQGKAMDEVDNCAPQDLEDLEHLEHLERYGSLERFLEDLDDHEYEPPPLSLSRLDLPGPHLPGPHLPGPDLPGPDLPDLPERIGGPKERIVTPKIVISPTTATTTTKGESLSWHAGGFLDTEEFTLAAEIAEIAERQRSNSVVGRDQIAESHLKGVAKRFKTEQGLTKQLDDFRQHLDCYSKTIDRIGNLLQAHTHTGSGPPSFDHSEMAQVRKMVSAEKERRLATNSRTIHCSKEPKDCMATESRTTHRSKGKTAAFIGSSAFFISCLVIVILWSCLYRRRATHPQKSGLF